MDHEGGTEGTGSVFGRLCDTHQNDEALATILTIARLSPPWWMNDSQHDRRYRKSPRLGAIVKSLVIRFGPCRAGTRRSRDERSEVRFVSRLEPAQLRFEFRLRPFTTFGDVFGTRPRDIHGRVHDACHLLRSILFHRDVTRGFRQWQKFGFDCTRIFFVS